MRVLHITNDYTGSSVYTNLVRELDSLLLEQVVYTPLRDFNKIGGNSIDFQVLESEIVYSKILNSFSDRILFFSKINKIVKDIESKVDLTKISLIHAHTMFSDGGVAYILSRKYNIPFIVAIRNTDLNLFLKYLKYLVPFGRKILIGAHKIITISPVYKDRIISYIGFKEIKDIILNKTIVLPNGVDSYWLKNRLSQNKTLLCSEDIKLLYIGKFDKGKNVCNLILAVAFLKKEYSNIKLTLVGGSGNDEKKVTQLINKYDFVSYLGKVNNKDCLKYIFNNHDFFVMPSRAETFGLVYIEALLQGLPILYTNKEGIDGYYLDNIGEKVFDFSAQEIAKKIKMLIESKDDYKFETSSMSEQHDWKLIANKYLSIYKNE